jgi:hypothetical protein
MNQSHNFFAHLTHNIGLMTILVILVAVVAFFVAKKFGGKSRAKRKLIFTFIGVVGLGLVATYISSQL